MKILLKKQEYSEEAKGEIYCKEVSKGYLDTRKIIALVADDFLEVAQRFLDNREKLDKLEEKKLIYCIDI